MQPNRSKTPVPAPACTIAIFGAVGDLTKTLLMPAIYDLCVAGLLDERTKIVGLDHNDRDRDGWRGEMNDALRVFIHDQGNTAVLDEAALAKVLAWLDYVRFDFTQSDDYEAFAKSVAASENVLFYLAVAPRFFETIVAGLSGAGLLKQGEGAFRRVVIEKPFGSDLRSARELNAKLAALADESQYYRIDHFLGKEAVQGIPVLRFANGMFEPLLNRESIASVQITAAETIGVAERGSFYETTGALRDMIPNHLFSLLTMVAMDEPAALRGDHVRDAKASLLRSLRPIGLADVALGQYGAGTVAGQAVRAYRDEDNVDRNSRTETYVAVSVRIDNDRWRDVPFYLRTGKRMSAHVTTIALELRKKRDSIDTQDEAPNLLLLGIDPQRGLLQRYVAKRPGVDLQVGPVAGGFRYETAFDEPPNVGYETLLYHALRADPMLFQRSDMIEYEWAALQPALDEMEARHLEPAAYRAGDDGPAVADDLLARDGNAWLAVAPLEALGG